MTVKAVPSPRKSEVFAQFNTPRAIWHWLSGPRPPAQAVERRQGQLLSTLLLSLILSSLLALIPLYLTAPDGNLLLAPALPVAMGAAIFLILAYGVNRTGHYTLAAGLTISVVALGAWAGIFTSRNELDANALLLVFGLISVLLSSVLLSVRTTIILALANIAGLFLVLLFVPQIDGDQFMGPLTFNIIISALIVVAARISQLDRTQIDRQTRELAEIAERVQQILDTVSEGLLLLDNGQRVLLANPAAATYLALLGDAGVGDHLTHLGEQPIQQLLGPPPADKLSHELWLEKPERRIFDLTARPMAAGPVVKGWVLTLRDVTMERQVQERIQQQERLAAIGQLAAGIAHDFNNIMAVIVLYTQLVRRTAELSTKDGERLDTIYKQATHAANLIHQILDFSRRSVMERGPLDLLPFLKEFLKFVKRTLPENIVLDPIFDEDEYIVSADPTRLQQVLMNLVVNARDVMPDGGTLRLSLSQLALKPGQKPPLPEMSPGKWHYFTVLDTGLGIAPEHMPHIFEPFFTTKLPGQGTGLGLAQVYGIVKQHDGYIGVTSHVGRGTTFTIYLPALTFPGLELITTQETTLTQAGAETILLVEDDDTTREAVCAILETLNYRVMMVSDGREALALYERHSRKISLVLSDLVMPNLGGVELYKTLKAQWQEVKLVIMTGYPLEDEGKTLLEQGIVAWIRKPFTVEAIAEKIRRVLKA